MALISNEFEEEGNLNQYEFEFKKYQISIFYAHITRLITISIHIVSTSHSSDQDQCLSLETSNFFSFKHYFYLSSFLIQTGATIDAISY